MRYILRLLFICILFSSCSNETAKQSFPEAFMTSLQQNDFEALKDFIPTVDFYKSLGEDLPARSDEEIAKFLAEGKLRLKEGWEKVRQQVQEKSIDWKKFSIKETIVYDPFPSPTMEATLIVYSYDGKDWDDLSFITKEQEGKTWLLEFPNPTGFFSMSNKSLRNLQNAKATLLLQDPGFAQKVKDRVQQLMQLAKGNDAAQLAPALVFKGEDEARKWKTALDAKQPGDLKMAENEMKRIIRALEGCNDMQFEKIISERESEGQWIVQPVTCGSKKIHFAFLLINEQLLLGDLETEGVDEF